MLEVSVISLLMSDAFTLVAFFAEKFSQMVVTACKSQQKMHADRRKQTGSTKCMDSFEFSRGVFIKQTNEVFTWYR